jgi:hypothetical protein
MLSGERIEKARLADAVAPQHAGHPARLGGERHVAQGLRCAVVQINRVDLQHHAEQVTLPVSFRGAPTVRACNP